MQLQIISCEMLEEYLKRSDILLLDLRSKDEYNKEHIPSTAPGRTKGPTGRKECEPWYNS